MAHLMTYHRNRNHEVIGGAVIALMIVAFVIILITFMLSEAWQAIPREFNATCENVGGGDVCRITF